jgi:hypothetical protein
MQWSWQRSNLFTAVIAKPCAAHRYLAVPSAVRLFPLYLRCMAAA